MKYRILETGFFGGTYSDEFLENNSYTLEWSLTSVEPDFSLIKLYWNGEIWVEGATEEEILQALEPQVSIIKAEYDGLIRTLSEMHIIRLNMVGTPIPSEVISEYNRLILECNDKIKEIIPTATYSKTPNSTIKK